MGAGTSGRSLTSCVRFQALRCLERIARFPLAGLACTPVLSLVAAFFFSAELGTKPRAFHMLGKCSTIESYPSFLLRDC